ncbi:MAG: energy-coupling factor transporter transmembrane protein EcfT [Propionibacteriaceae bacterium]|nr:energy-coupling factor transporter transmembrane protein EcfT [Propionibacteriaceae bacterium]
MTSQPTRHTVLDSVNPVTRLGAAMILTFPLFITLDWVSATVVVALEIIIWLSLAPSEILARLRTLALRALPFVIVAPLTGLSLALYGRPGGHIFFSWGFIVISEQSLSFAAAVTARVLAFGMACLVTLIGVDPTDLADGLAQVWHLPARFVLGVLAATRLLVRLGHDWKTMTLARRARGLGDHHRLHRYATIGFALIVSALRRGSTLATAMEVRGFGRGKRTWARESKVGLADGVCLIVACAIVGIGLFVALATGEFRWIGSVV